MAEEPSFLDPSAVARLEGLEMVARHIVEGFLRGHHKSLAAGSSSDPKEQRAYAPGDDLRRIDWRGFARNDRVTIRQFEDETNVRAYLVLDISASMGFDSSTLLAPRTRRPPDGPEETSGGGLTKLRYAICLAAAVGWVLLGQRDAVGLVLASDRLLEEIPPRASAQHFAGVLARLEHVRAEGPTRLGPALHLLSERIRRRSLVLVFSDFIDDPTETLTGFASLRQRGAEAFAFEIHDPAELELPLEGWTVFRDIEGGSPSIKLDARDARSVYRDGVLAHLEALERGFAAAEADHLVLRTDAPFEDTLGRYLHLRSRRGR